MARPWQTLVSAEDAFPEIQAWVKASPLDVSVLPAERQAAERTLEALEVTTRSPMGALAFHTGGLLVDHRWLRVLGAGGPALPRSLDQWNNFPGPFRCSEGLLVADDVMGGFFAWFRQARTIHYLAPDTLRWEDLELGYSDWLRWCLTDRLPRFYAELRWDGWIEELETLPADRGIHVSPPLFTKGPPIAQRSRRGVPVEELWNWAIDLGEQLKDAPDGQQIRLVAKDA